MVGAGGTVVKEDARPLFPWCHSVNHTQDVYAELRSPERQLKGERPRGPDLANELTLADSI